MQTILGANGQIAVELAKELHRKFTKDIRLVSRDPNKVHTSDTLVSANLLNLEATEKAVEGSEIAYLTVGLPLDSKIWEEQFPVIMQNVISACKKHKVKLAFFDNTYMYPKNSEPQTEETVFEPEGRKSKVRATMAEMLLKEMQNGSLQAVICRAPEFYGPDKTQSFTNNMIFNKIANNKKLKVPLKDNTKRTLIWSPDASRALAIIGNTPDAFGQTWHLPCDDWRPTYKELIESASEIYDRKLNYSIIKLWQFKIGGLFNKNMKELQELLPRYKHDNIFVSDKFKSHFPHFKVTPIERGIGKIKKYQSQK